MSPRNLTLGGALCVVLATLVLLPLLSSDRDSAANASDRVAVAPGGTAGPGALESATHGNASAAGTEEEGSSGDERAAVAAASVPAAEPDDGSFQRDAVYGRLVDPAGEPLSDVELLLLPLRLDVEELESIEAEARSDEGGRFRFEGVEPFESRRVFARAEGFKTTVLVTRPGHDEDHELTPTVAISGRVLEAGSERPIEGVCLWTGGLTYDGLRFERRPRSVSDAQGRYELPSVSMDGLLTVYVERDGHLTETRKFQVTEGVSDGYDVRLGLGPLLVLELYDLDSGEALADFDVNLRRHQEARTDADGRIELVRSEHELERNIASRLEVHAEGYCSTYVRPTIEETDAEVVVRVPMYRGATVVGNVVSFAGLPIEDATVWVGRGRYELPKLPAGVSIRDREDQRPVSDDMGQFEATGLVPRQSAVRIGARHPDYVSAESDEVMLGFAGDQAAVQVVLEKGGRLEGIVTVNGEPSSVRLTWSAEGGYGSNHSNDAGEYLFDSVTPGEVKLTANLNERSWGSPGQAPDVVWVEDGETTLHDLKILTSSKTISGIVLDDLGNPVRGADVSAWADRSENRRRNFYVSQESDDDGRFELAVEEEPGLLYQVAANLGPQYVVVEKVVAGTGGLEIVLPALGKLALEVTDALTGESVQGFELQWRATDGERGYRRFRDGSSSFSPGPDGIYVAELPVGEVDLLVLGRSLGYIPAELLACRVREEEPGRPVEVSLVQGTELHLTIKSAVEGVPFHRQLRRGRIFVSSDEQMAENEVGGSWARSELRRGQAVRLSGKGTCMLRGLAPGRYRFRSVPEDLEFEPRTFEVPAVDEVHVEVKWRQVDPKKKGKKQAR